MTPRKAAPVPVGARIIDSLPFSQGGTLAQAKRLKETGVDGVALYLGAATPELVENCIAAGLGVLAVTFGGDYDGTKAAVRMKNLGLPVGTSCFFDVEGKHSYDTDPNELSKALNNAVIDVGSGGFVGGYYFGVPQPLDSNQMYALKGTRYWRGQGSIRDHSGQLAEPSGCGWCMTQMWPSRFWPNDTDPNKVYVDVNIAGQDYKGRAANWAVKA